MVLPPPLTICMCLNSVLPRLVPHAESNWNDRKSLFCPFQKEFWSSNLRLPSVLWQNVCWNSFLFPNLLQRGTYLSQISKVLDLCVFISINIILEFRMFWNKSEKCLYFYFVKQLKKSNGDYFCLQYVQDFLKGSLNKTQTYKICVLWKHLYVEECQPNLSQTQKLEMGKSFSVHLPMSSKNTETV